MSKEKSTEKQAKARLLRIWSFLVQSEVFELTEALQDNNTKLAFIDDIVYRLMQAVDKFALFVAKERTDIEENAHGLNVSKGKVND